MHFCDSAVNAIRLSDPFLMVSFHLSRCVCVAMLLFLLKGKATLLLATVMHAINASLLCKIDLSKRECADGFFLTKDIGYCVV